MKNKKRKYKKKNKKGFSLVELLAVIAILGILSGVAIMAYNRYIEYSHKKSYENLGRSTIRAAEQFILDHPNVSEIDLENLFEGNYLNNINDPKIKNSRCKGVINITNESSSSKLSKKTVTPHFCCNGYNFKYNPDTNKIEPESRCETDTYGICDLPTINVLQIYPTASAKKLSTELSDETIKSWIREEADSKTECLSEREDKIMNIVSISIDEFNNSPETYLVNIGSKWNYDLIVFGFWDCNNRKDLSEKSYQIVKNYLNYGGSVIFGHDTITDSDCGDHSHFNNLSSYAGIELKHQIGNFKKSNRVKIVREGNFTTYPFNIGTKDDILDINYSHVYGQKVVNADIWMTFEDINESEETKKIYLSTREIVKAGTNKKSINSFIQTGHSNGKITKKEFKIIANIIFYTGSLKYT